MMLSDFMNNAVTATVTCLVALGTEYQLGANPDAFLMAAAIGASCAFLTPGVAAINMPMLLWIWPL